MADNRYAIGGFAQGFTQALNDASRRRRLKAGAMAIEDQLAETQARRDRVQSNQRQAIDFAGRPQELIEGGTRAPSDGVGPTFDPAAMVREGIARARMDDDKAGMQQWAEMGINAAMNNIQKAYQSQDPEAQKQALIAANQMLGRDLIKIDDEGKLVNWRGEDLSDNNILDRTMTEAALAFSDPATRNAALLELAGVQGAADLKEREFADASARSWAQISNVARGLGIEERGMQMEWNQFVKEHELDTFLTLAEAKQKNAMADYYRQQALSEQFLREQTNLASPIVWEDPEDLRKAVGDVHSRIDTAEEGIMGVGSFTALAEATGTDPNIVKERGKTIAGDAVAQHGPAAASRAPDGAAVVLDFLMQGPQSQAGARFDIVYNDDDPTGLPSIAVNPEYDSAGQLTTDAFPISRDAARLVETEMRKRSAADEAAQTEASNAQQRSALDNAIRTQSEQSRETVREGRRGSFRTGRNTGAGNWEDYFAPIEGQGGRNTRNRQRTQGL